LYLRLQEKDLRGYVDHRNEKMGRKIRDAEIAKVPFMIVVGEKEQAEGVVSVRKKGDGDVGSMTLDAFIAMAQEEIQSLTYEK
jgi:threonyl-tRNA synthetase